MHLTRTLSCPFKELPPLCYMKCGGYSWREETTKHFDTPSRSTHPGFSVFWLLLEGSLALMNPIRKCLSVGVVEITLSCQHYARTNGQPWTSDNHFFDYNQVITTASWKSSCCLIRRRLSSLTWSDVICHLSHKLLKIHAALFTLSPTLLLLFSKRATAETFSELSWIQIEGSLSFGRQTH